MAADEVEVARSDAWQLWRHEVENRTDGINIWQNLGILPCMGYCYTYSSCIMGQYMDRRWNTGYQNCCTSKMDGLANKKNQMCGPIGALILTHTQYVKRCQGWKPRHYTRWTDHFIIKYYKSFGANHPIFVYPISTHVPQGCDQGAYHMISTTATSFQDNGKLRSGWSQLQLVQGSGKSTSSCPQMCCFPDVPARNSTMHLNFPDWHGSTVDSFC